MDAIDQAVYDRLYAARDCFPHVVMGVFAVPVDALFVEQAIGALVRDGVPRRAIRRAEPSPTNAA
jgi:hypothetical protein